MATKEGKDKFPNLAIVSGTQTAANTLTYIKIETGISFNDKVAWILHRIEYSFPEVRGKLGASTDTMIAGLCYSNSVAIPNLIEPLVIDLHSIERGDFGTAATAILSQMPIVHSFEGLPGGGLIVPPNPLYAFINSAGADAAVSVVLRIYYSVLPLATEDFWELVEARRVLTA